VNDFGENTPVRTEKSIFAAMQRAGEFYKTSREIAIIVREHVGKSGRRRSAPAHRDVPRPLWLRRAFGEWLAGLCSSFAGHEDELKLHIYQLLEMAWYGQLANPERRAPGWLIGWPADAESKSILNVRERLDAAETWRIEGEILAHIEKLAPSRASEVVEERDTQPPNAQAAPRRASRPRPLDVFQKSMKANPSWPYVKICGDVDFECESKHEPVPIPPKCRKHGHTNSLESIRCPDCRNTMQVLLNRKRANSGLELPNPSRSRF
jgi:hypothetical protein